MLLLAPAPAVVGLAPAAGLLQAALLLGAWLLAVRGAGRTRLAAGQRAWLALAVAALYALLALGLWPALAWLGNRVPALGAGLGAASALLSLAMIAAAWWVVCRQLRGRLLRAAWWPWWLAPLLMAILSTVYNSLVLWYTFSPALLSTATLLRTSGASAGSVWLYSVLTLLVLRPVRSSPDYESWPMT